ncbi:MAG: LuxR family transcriptional regulator [Kineosporiaceae bacterium]
MRHGPPREEQRSRTGPTPTTGPPEPTGRERELAQLRDFVPDLAAGRGGLVLLTGPTGIGKTYLAHTFLQDLPPSVLTVTTSPLGYLRTPGLWPVHQIARALLPHGPDSTRQEFARLTDDPGRDELPEIVLVERMVELLTALTAAGPVTALLDDLDRADPQTVAVIEALSERLDTHPLLLLACARTGDATDPAPEQALRRLRGRPHTLALHLTGLAQNVIEHLIGTVRTEIGPDDRREIARVSAGNPLLSQELAHLWAAQRRIADCGGPEPRVPASATLRELVAERLASVDADEVLAPLAVLGRPATLSLLAEAGGVPAPAVRRVVERASAVGLVTVEGTLGDLRMAHPVFGDVLRERLTIHLRLADLFDRSPAVPGPHHVERARHLIAAGDDTAATAAACLAAARYEESVGDLPSARELLAYALDTCDSDQPTRVHLLRLYGRCLARTGRGPEARHQLLRAVHTARLTTDADLLAAAVLDLTAADDGSADRERTVDLLQDCLAGPAGTRPGPTRALLLARMSSLVHLSDPQRAWHLAQEAVSSAGNDRKAVREANQALALVANGVTHLPQTERIRSLLTARGHVPRADSFAAFLGPALIRGDRAAVEHYLARIDEDAAHRPGRRPRGLLAVARLGLAVADADAGAVTTLLHEVGRSPLVDVRMLAVVLHMFWQLHTGAGAAAVPGARPRTGRAAPDSRAAPSAELADLLAVTRSAVLAARADPEATTWLRSRLDRKCPLLTAMPGPVQDLAWAVSAFAGQVLGNQDCSRGALAHFTDHEDTFVTVSTALIGPVGWFSALAHETLGQIPEGLRANARAMELSRRFDSPTWTARCLIQRSRLLAASGSPDAAGPATEAVALARALQLAGLTAEAERGLEALRPPTHPLDDRQLELLRLAGDGLRNDQIAGRLFVSTATVERHFSQIYRTIGVPNRAAAVQWLSSHVPAAPAPDAGTGGGTPTPGNVRARPLG